jgi:hypothetical protein
MNDTRPLATFLRIYGVLVLAVFGALFVGFMMQTPLLAENGGPLNWLIWNDVRFGDDHAHVSSMLLLIYMVWGVFLLRAAGDPPAHRSFLDFTMWANAAHGLLMIVQAAMDLERYWSKFFTDIPFVLILAIGIYLWRPRTNVEHTSGQQISPGDRGDTTTQRERG